MKKVTIFVGSPHKGGATQRAARAFLGKLESFGDVEGEIVQLGDHALGVCRGCKTCFERGEERCPLKDDRDTLVEKMTASDGVVFAAPNYSFQVAATMKIFLDRLGYLFHRPRMHGRTATSIAVFGIYGGGKLVKYLDFAAGGLGFNVVKGEAIRTLEPMDDKALAKMDQALTALSRRFHRQLMRPAYPVPSLIQLMVFRMGRTSIRLLLPEDRPDYRHYERHGWFESDYYYPTRLGVPKRALAAFFDWYGARVFTPSEVKGP